MSRTKWRMVAEEVVTCNCAWGCPCQFNALPTYRRCEALAAVRVLNGHYGDTNLDGVAFANAYWWPGAVHEGNGVTQLAVDASATAAQRAAIVNIVSGKEGGTFFEIFASTVTTVVDPIFVPFHFESDRETRRARLVVPGLGEFHTEPIKNRVTGAEQRGRIELPNGFEFKLAEVANCVEHHAEFGGKAIVNHNSNALFAAVDWSNA